MDRNKKAFTATQKAAALAGSAAATLAATSQPADAAIVIANDSPSPVVSAGGTTEFLWDVDGGGANDFRLFTTTSSSSSSSYTNGYFGSKGLGGRGMINAASRSKTDNVQNLFAGLGAFQIGPTLAAGYNWGQSNTDYRRMTSYGSTTGYDFDGGTFGSDQNYIGFRFDIGGNTHYGWAQLNLASQQIVAAAYNNVAGQPVIVGQIPEPSSMALLGLGAAGLAMLRRRTKR